MNSFLGFWTLMILLFLIFACGLIFLSYWIPKKFGKRKLGIVISIIVFLIMSSPILSFLLEDYLFFKSDVIKNLKEHEVILQDHFDLQTNEISGIRDYYQRFVLKITPEDKERLIRKFIQMSCYRDSVPSGFDFRFDKPRYSDRNEEFIITYQDKYSYVLEYYKPNRQGYSPTWDKISISKNEDHLIFERVLD